MAIEITPVELTVFHTSVEKIAGTISALIAHYQREGSREFVNLLQLAMEDCAQQREILRSKGASIAAPEVRIDASKIGVEALKKMLASDPGRLAPVDLDQHSGEQAAS